MSDISMCSNTKCPLKEKCYRFKAVPNKYRQSYMSYKYEDGNCPDFYPINKEHEVKVNSSE